MVVGDSLVVFGVMLFVNIVVSDIVGSVDGVACDVDFIVVVTSIVRVVVESTFAGVVSSVFVDSLLVVCAAKVVVKSVESANVDLVLE